MATSWMRGALALGLALCALTATVRAQDDEDFPTLYTDWEAKIEAALTGKNYSFSRWEIFSATHDRVSPPSARLGPTPSLLRD